MTAFNQPHTTLSVALEDLQRDPITVNDLLHRYRQLDEQERFAKEGKDEIRTALKALRDAGAIEDKFTASGFSVTWTKRTTYTYSKAVKELQDMEKLNGLATPKVSESWTIRNAEQSF